MLKELMSSSENTSSSASSSRAPVLWALLGFVGGLLPLLVFVVSVSTSKQIAPEPLPEPSAATTRDAIAANVSERLRPAMHPSVSPHTATAEPGDAVDVAPPTAENGRRDRVAGMTPIAQVESAPAGGISRIDATAQTAAEPAAAKAADIKQPPAPPAKRQAAPAVQTVKAPARVERQTVTETRPTYQLSEIVENITGQQWAQRTATAAFPKSGRIQCESDKTSVTCWTNVLAGDHYTGPYRYKVKMILDKFNADGSFVMTHRDLILKTSASPSAAETEDINISPSSIKPGWAPMIHRLPCQLRGQDKIACNPVGENSFVLSGTRLQAHVKP